MTDPQVKSVTARLRDGTRVIARPVQPEDRESLRAGFEKLSTQSRYWRFHASIKHLSEEQLTYFTEVDHVDHEAWLLLDLDQPESPGIGVARYVRDQTDPAVAEAAIVIADEYQGQGAGTLLLGLLANRARANGITVFRNYVLSDNTAMLDLFRTLGCTIRQEPGEEVLVVDMPLPEEDERLLDSPPRKILATVADTRQVLGWLVPPAWDISGRRERHPQAAPADIDLRRELERLRDEMASWLRAYRGKD